MTKSNAPRTEAETTTTRKPTSRGALRRSTPLMASPVSAPRRVARARTEPGSQPDRPRLLLPPTPSSSHLGTPAWWRKWDPVRRQGHQTGVYFAGCSGLVTLGARLRLPTYKPGTAEYVDERMSQLSAQGYGRLVMRDGEWVEESGFCNWKAARLSARPCHPASPVRVLPRQLIVTLPSWMSRNQFEAQLNAELAHVSLAGIVGTRAGWELCRSQACDLDELLRYTGSPSDPVLATEIAAISPWADTARLVALIEAMMIAIILDGDHGEN